MQISLGAAVDGKKTHHWSLTQIIPISNETRWPEQAEQSE
jgi:hypothetical protein